MTNGGWIFIPQGTDEIWCIERINAHALHKREALPGKFRVGLLEFIPPKPFSNTILKPFDQHAFNTDPRPADLNVLGAGPTGSHHTIGHVTYACGAKGCLQWKTPIDLHTKREALSGEFQNFVLVPQPWG